MVVDKKISELLPLTGALAPDTAYFEIVNPDEPDPDLQNMRITISQLKVAVGIYEIFEVTGVNTTITDARLVGKSLTDIKQVMIGSTDQVTGNNISSFNTGTGTITLGADMGGEDAMITVQVT